MALKLPTKIFLFLQKMNLRTLYFKPIVAKTLAHTLYPTAIWDEVCTGFELCNGHLVLLSKLKINIFTFICIAIDSRANMKISMTVDENCWYAITIPSCITIGRKVENACPTRTQICYCYFKFNFVQSLITPVLKLLKYLAFLNIPANIWKQNL